MFYILVLNEKLKNLFKVDYSDYNMVPLEILRGDQSYHLDIFKTLNS